MITIWWRRTGLVLLMLAGVLPVPSWSSLASASVIRVPADYPTIGHAVDAATDGSVIHVSPGLYEEVVIVDGKALSIVAPSGFRDTRIEGGVVFRNQADGLLKGFAIQNSFTGVRVESSSLAIEDNWIVGNLGGGGISVEGPGQVSIQHNLIVSNWGCEGAGIGVVEASPTIRYNRISENRGALCSGAPGAGIYLVRTTGARVSSNQISDNFADGSGAGVYAFQNHDMIVADNHIFRNESLGVANRPSAVEIVNLKNDGGPAPVERFTRNIVEANLGMGVYLTVEQNGGLATVSNNLIIGNTYDSFGAGITASGPGQEGGETTAQYRIINNTLVGNAGSSTIWAGGFDESAVIRNNVIMPAEGFIGLECSATGNLGPPKTDHNNIWAPAGPTSTGDCPDIVGTKGNFSADPLFVNDEFEFRVQPGSPLIDAGGHRAAPLVDLAGAARPLDGDGDGSAVVDIGAYEYTVPQCRGLAATIIGTRRADSLQGTAGKDVIVGYEGDDVIVGLAGNDVICGGPGDDSVDGGPGRDFARGEGGRDELRGGGGNDHLIGGPDSDMLFGGAGGDILLGRGGADEVAGGPDADFLYGGDGGDLLVGGGGADRLSGRLGNDELWGRAGDDLLFGNRGRDDLKGGLDNDAADGGFGVDSCVGELIVDCEN